MADPIVSGTSTGSTGDPPSPQTGAGAPADTPSDATAADDAGATLNGTGDTKSASWLDGVSDDIRGDPTLANLDSVDALAREHVNLQKVLGKKGVPLPGETGTTEEWDAFYNAIGRPETADNYDFEGFKPPETLPWDNELVTAMRPSFHKHGLTQKQAEGVLTDYADMNAIYRQYFSRGPGVRTCLMPNASYEGNDILMHHPSTTLAHRVMMLIAQ